MLKLNLKKIAEQSHIVICFLRLWIFFEYIRQVWRRSFMLYLDYRDRELVFPAAWFPLRNQTARRREWGLDDSDTKCWLDDRRRWLITPTVSNAPVNANTCRCHWSALLIIENVSDIEWFMTMNYWAQKTSMYY